MVHATKKREKQEDSQLLPDAPQPGLGVSQLHGQVLLVLTGQAAGGAWCGVWTRELARAGRVLCLEVVPLLCQVHDQLQETGIRREHTSSPVSPRLAQGLDPD